MHLNSLKVFERYALPLLTSGTLLEIAPDTLPASSYVKLALEKQSELRFDLFRANPAWPEDDPHFIHQYRKPPHDFICNPEWFDTILAGQVLEHVDRPWVFVPQLARMLKPGGLLILIAPLTAGEHRVKCGWGRKFDCWRVLPQGMEVLFEDAGLETVLAEKAHIKSGRKEAKAQFTPGPGWDTIGIARKPV